MFVLGNLISAVATVLDYALALYMWIIIIRSVLSWVSPDPYNPIVRMIYNLTEPALYAVRRRLPIGLGGIDLSPMIVLLGIVFLRRFIVSTLTELAMRMM